MLTKLRVIDKRVKPGKGCGPDNITARGLKLGGDAVAVGLSYIMGESLKTSKYPSQWKMSKVKAVPKKGNSSERGDFRPISLLSIPSKMYESIIGDHIDCHFVNKGLSSENQWGFKPNRSTELLMLHLTEGWRQGLDRNRIVGVLFIDFKKAFDSICHKTMALKLQACGISGNVYNLIVDYLSGESSLLRLRVKDLVKRKSNSVYLRAQYLGLGFLVFMSTIFHRCLAVEGWKCLLTTQLYIVLAIPLMMSVPRSKPQ